MSDDTRPLPGQEPVDPADVERLREEVARLRLPDRGRGPHPAGGRRRRGRGRAHPPLGRRGRLSCRPLLDRDGFERLTLESDRARCSPYRWPVERSEPDPGRRLRRRSGGRQGVYVGVELIDAGNSVAGFTTIEGQPPGPGRPDPRSRPAARAGLLRCGARGAGSRRSRRRSRRGRSGAGGPTSRYGMRRSWTSRRTWRTSTPRLSATSLMFSSRVSGVSVVDMDASLVGLLGLERSRHSRHLR